MQILQDAASRGLNVTVKPMLMDFGYPGDWGDALVSAANATLGHEEAGGGNTAERPPCARDPWRVRARQRGARSEAGGGSEAVGRDLTGAKSSQASCRNSLRRDAWPAVLILKYSARRVCSDS